MAVAKTRPQSVAITVPHLPHRELSPNARLFYFTRNRLMQAAKDEVVAELRSQGCAQDPLWPKAHLTITFQAKDRRRRDLDNLVAACKPWIDGLVGEVIVDDSADRLSISASYEIGTEEQTRMEVSCEASDTGELFTR